MKLTEKEKQVWELLSQGFNKKGISKLLKISETTVATHVIRIYEKLQISGLSKYRNLQTTAALIYLNRNNHGN